MPANDKEEMVVLVNKVTRNKMSLAAEEVELFLRKHKLFEKMHVAAPEEKKVRRKAPAKKPPVIQTGRKRGFPEKSVKSSPSSSFVGDVSSKRMKKEHMIVPLKLEPVKSGLLVLTLKEMHEITRLFTSSLPGCADWASIASGVCGDRFTPAEIEHVANEFVPHIHFRPSVGMVVMERSGAKHSEFLRHRMTIKRMKQGLPILAQKFKSLTGLIPSPPISTPPISSPPNSSPVTPDVSSAVSVSSARPTVETYLSLLSTSTRLELETKARAAIQRFIRGEVPSYALRVCASEDMTATGRIKKRYETKAIRLAKQAATVVTPVPKSAPTSAPPAFFFSTAKHFAYNI